MRVSMNNLIDRRKLKRNFRKVLISKECDRKYSYSFTTIRQVADEIERIRYDNGNPLYWAISIEKLVNLSPKKRRSA